MSDIMNDWGLVEYGDLFGDIYHGMNTVYDIFVEQTFNIDIPLLDINIDFNLIEVMFGLSLTTFVSLVLVRFLKYVI